MPVEIKASKPTLDPGEFIVPAAPYGDVAVLHVGISRYRPYFGSNFPPLMVPELGLVIANSIVNDFVNAVPGVTGEDRPGLYVLRNKIHIDEVRAKYKRQTEEAREAQEQWFWKLMMMADDTYPALGNKAIMKIQRDAARYMGYIADWNRPDHRFIERLISEGKVSRATASK